MILLLKLILASNRTLQNICPDTKLNHIKHKRNILTEKTYERFKIRYKKFYSQEEIENIHKHVLKLEKTKEIENLRIRNDYIKVDLETWLSKHRMKILEVMLEVSDLYFGQIQKILFCLVDNFHGRFMSNYRTFMNK
ncbi:hypothetical protein TUBRATIS_12660 [Tubulinosema ratisbonensis]|uniref:Uncharacterized protein n=1 Tax=Tubulinosema ratisbonensis TaxID=291195 RepID=A0A437AM36_9MICR|nr:hypothetical protein TUBRATIS_12660 [Tubulinosema ratisbonensis]